jgi:hypothetical protein
MATDNEGWETVTDENGWEVVVGATYEGTDEDRKARGAEAKANMEMDTKLARQEAIPDWQKNLMPYSTQEQVNTGDSDLFSMSTLKDAFSLPGRLMSTSLSPEWDQMAKTSEEYDGIIGKVGTSPVTGVTALAAPFAPLAAGLLPASAPAWTAPVATGLAEGIVGTTAGATMDENYGGSDAALDIGLSLTIPVLGPVIKKIGSNLAKQRIAKILAENNADASPEMVNKIYTRLVQGGGEMGTNQAKLGKEITDKNLSYMMRDMEPNSFLSDVDTQDEIISDIKSSLGKESTLFKPRNLKQATTDIARVQEFFRKQAILKEGLDRPGWGGFLEPEEYKQHMLDLVQEYSDIPELMDLVQGNLSRASARTPEDIASIIAGDPSQPKGVLLDELSAVSGNLDDFFNKYPDMGRVKLRDLTSLDAQLGKQLESLQGMPLNYNKSGLDWAKVANNMKSGRLLEEGGLATKVPFDYGHPIVSTVKKVGANIPSVMFPLSEMASEGIRFLPQITREMYGEPVEDTVEPKYEQPKPKIAQKKAPKKQFGIGFQK